jgi:hypothetical protein
MKGNGMNLTFFSKRFVANSTVVLVIIMLLPLAVTACNIQKQTSSVPGAKTMNFRFEDYNVEELKVIQAKLYQFFPKGSSISEFQSAMEQLGAKCYTGGDPRTWEFDDDVMYCQYRIETGFLTITQWTVVVRAKDRKNISELRVNAGIIAP